MDVNVDTVGESGNSEVAHSEAGSAEHQRRHKDVEPVYDTRGDKGARERGAALNVEGADVALVQCSQAPGDVAMPQHDGGFGVAVDGGVGLNGTLAEDHGYWLPLVQSAALGARGE